MKATNLYFLVWPYTIIDEASVNINTTIFIQR